MKEDIEKYAVSSNADPRIVQLLSAVQTAYQAQSEALKNLENQIIGLFIEFGLEERLAAPTTPQPPVEGQQG